MPTFPTRPTLVFCSLLLAALPVSAQDWSVDWSTVDGGGEIAAEGGDWSLSGTFGQWDATDTGAASGGSWELTGGFWSLGTESDFLFKDSFES
jgi:hypothetical protein